MMGQAFPDTISRTAAVTAPALMVLGIILFMGKVSGAHLNPAVSIAFALRGDFPWRRVPGYIVVQLIGATLAAWFLQAVIGVSSSYGSNVPAPDYSNFLAFVMEVVLTFGLVSVILGTASGAQNLGVIGALGVGGYIALAGLWGSPISGASMNPARTFGPTWSAWTSAPTGSTWPGRSPAPSSPSASRSCCADAGGGRAGSGAAQGALFTEVANPQAMIRGRAPLTGNCVGSGSGRDAAVSLRTPREVGPCTPVPAGPWPAGSSPCRPSCWSWCLARCLPRCWSIPTPTPNAPPPTG